MLNGFVTFLQFLSALGVIILMAVQSDKAEQGGVMGLGAAGGRTAGDIDMAVGPERILKPMTRWLQVGLLVTSMLGAIPANKITVFHLLAGVVAYLVIMMFGSTIWAAMTGNRR